jgi:hypothetical protein
MKIQDGKKIYFKHAGVNQPAEIPELDWSFYSYNALTIFNNFQSIIDFCLISVMVFMIDVVKR